jgi:hypothetical protein
MIDPALLLFGSHKEAIVFFSAMMIYVTVIALMGYIQTKDKEEKKTAISFLVFFDSLSAVSLAIVVYFGYLAV